jgi:predicted dehydrogenase
MAGSRQPLRIALAGCGGIARQYHLRALRRMASARMVAVADPDPAARDLAASATGAEPFADPLAAIEQPGVDAVVVCAPNAHHADLALAALGAGRHLYLEKPLATDVADGRRVVDAAERAGTVATVGFALRFDPLYARVRAALGQIGPLSEVSTTWFEPLAPGGGLAWKRLRATGGGALLDLGVHHLDLLGWLTGHTVAEVGDAVLSSDQGEHDGAWLAATTSGGADFEARFGYAAERRCAWVFTGERGWIAVDRCLRRVTVAAGAGVPRYRPRADAVRATLLGMPLVRRERTFARALGAWVRCARGGPRAPELATPADGLSSLEAIERVEAAAAVPVGA